MVVSQITVTDGRNSTLAVDDTMSTHDPNELDWDGCDVVLECTGKFNDGYLSAVHLERGARKVAFLPRHKR
jgi:glyceraldehyde 3-phosphate dehydrogenase